MKSVLTLLNRRRRGRELGVKFGRVAVFTLPSQILLQGGPRPVRLPSDKGSKNAFIDILLDDCYRLQSLPPCIGSVLDVGAHAGLFSLAARMRWPSARIHAYEPNPMMQGFVNQQAAIGDFQVFHEAVGFAEGNVSIDLGEDSVHTRTRTNEKGDISCVALATAVSRLGGRVDLIKMDCEGAEWELLQDGTSWNGIKHLAMEYHLWAGYSIEELKDLIRFRGFDVTAIAVRGEDFGLLFASRETPGVSNDRMVRKCAS